MASITVTVKNGQTIIIPWTAGLTAHKALEEACEQSGSPAAFTFGIQYYPSFGYLIFMINQTFDSWNPALFPYYYWEFLVNGERQAKGVDGTTLQSGDTVSFELTAYSEEKSGHPQAIAKRQASHRTG
jgi:hypothetical protein